MNSKISQRNRWHGVLMILFFCPAVISFAQNAQLVSALGGANSPSAGGNGASYLSMVSPDGRYVLFSSTANNLALTNNDGPALMTPELNVFLRDRVEGTTTLASLNPAGGSADEDCQPTGISTNGQYALFESAADNLAAGCTNTVNNVFVRDLVNNITTLVSVSTNGVEGNGNSYDSAITPNGRYVVFTSAANNLVPNDNNGIPDVFVRDLLNDTTTLVSTGAISAGTFSWLNGSGTPQITPDGRYVAFCSAATNLVPRVLTPGEVYVRDLVAGTTTWASTNARSLYKSVAGNTNAISSNEIISTNGEFVAFETGPTTTNSPALVLQFNLQTLATTLVSTNANVPPVATVTSADNFNRNMAMTPDGGMIAFVADGTASTTNTAIYLWNAQTGTNTLVSSNLTSGLPAVGICEEPVIDPTGQYVTYLSSATNLTAGVLTNGYHVYLWDILTGASQLVDAGTNAVAAGVYPTAICALSGDGSVYFDQCLENANLVTNDGNTGSDVLAYHSSTGTFELISACQPTLPSLTPNGLTKVYPTCVSTNGRYIAFVSEGNNLVANDTNVYPEVFVRDLWLGTNFLASADTNGLPAVVQSGEPSISGDGRYVAFSSYASNLVAGVSTNSENVFLRDLQSGATALVSIGTNGGAGNGDSYAPTISSDGRYILFHSRASNLTAMSPAPSLGIENLYLSDQLLATNYALTGIIFSNGPVTSMTPDGSYVAYAGIAGNSQTNLYVWDSQTANIIYTNPVTTLSAVTISPDGSWVAYATASSLWAVNLAGNTNYLVATNGFSTHPALQFSADVASLVFVQSNHVYLYDFQTATNLLVDRSFYSGNPANGFSGLPAISPNGRFVAYNSTATNIVPDDAAANGNIYLYDWANNATTLISLNLAGSSTANYWSLEPEFSGDGSTLVFQSYASDLSALAFNEFGAVFALNLSSLTATNSTGTNTAFYAQINGITAAGQNPANGNPAISWPVTPGNSYQVQYADDLANPVWQNVNGNMVFIGNSGQIIDLAPATSQRFYRIIAVP
ncbi:MAG TPA: hypothetical protein VNU95_08225 [Candidatus Acidoferrales bacterium]|nr:hypothetical protein [Candidatus Acidoferrales bacterium]